MIRGAIPGLIAALLCAMSGAGEAQTTSARSDSADVAKRAARLLDSGNSERAVRLYRRAIELDTTNESAYIGLSGALEARGLHAAALEALDRAETAVGWTAEIAIQRGIHLSRVERWDEAAAALARALKKRPRSFHAAYHLAAAQLARGEWESATAAFDVYLANRPETLKSRDHRVGVRRAYALLQAGKTSSARRALAKILTADADNTAARMLLFTALAKDGRCEKALALYAELSRAVERAPTMIYDAAVCQYRLGRSRDALRTLEKFPADRERPRQALLLSARIFVTLGETDQGIAAYEQAIAAGLDATLEFARWLSDIREYDRVVDLVWPAVEAGSRDPIVLSVAASALVEVGRLDRAAIASERLVAAQPDLQSWLLHGRIQLLRKQWTEAERVFTLARERQPNNSAAAAGVVTALQHQAHEAFSAKQQSAAQTLLARALTIDPENGAVAYNLAVLELERGAASAAIELLKPRMDNLPDPTRGQLLLGRALLAFGDRRGAENPLRNVAYDEYAPAPIRIRALVNLTWAESSRRPDRAAAHIARARKLAGDSLSAQLAADLDRAEAHAKLLAAEDHYKRRLFSTLGERLDEVDASKLSEAGKSRAKLLGLFSLANRKGLVAGLRGLSRIPDSELSRVGAGTVSTSDLRHALALHLGIRFLKRPSDYTRHLRPHATALHAAAKDSGDVKVLVSAWYDRALFAMIEARAFRVAKNIARSAPAAARKPRFEHNAIVAESARKTGHKPFTAAQKTRLDKLWRAIPESMVNLAIDASAAGNDGAALAYMKRASPLLQAAFGEWMRWKKAVHGSP